MDKDITAAQEHTLLNTSVEVDTHTSMKTTNTMRNIRITLRQKKARKIINSIMKKLKSTIQQTQILAKQKKAVNLSKQSGAQPKKEVLNTYTSQRRTHLQARAKGRELTDPKRASLNRILIITTKTFSRCPKAFIEKSTFKAAIAPRKYNLPRLTIRGTPVRRGKILHHRGLLLTKAKTTQVLSTNLLLLINQYLMIRCRFISKRTPSIKTNRTSIEIQPTNKNSNMGLCLCNSSRNNLKYTEE